MSIIKKLLAIAAMLFAVASFAAVEVNKASAEELDSVKGIGPAMAKKIVDERGKGGFKSWDDFVARVKGTGGGNAAKLSAAGLTVDGKTRDGAAASSTAKAEPAKPMAAPAPMPTQGTPGGRANVKAAPMDASRAAEPARK